MSIKPSITEDKQLVSTHIPKSKPGSHVIALPWIALPWLARALSLIFILAMGIFFALPKANAQDEVRIPQAQLDQILAPIALYPDTLLSHILISSTYPLEVVQAARWAQANEGLSSEERLELAEQQNWDPSIQALTPFPDVLNKMTEDLDWLQTLGDTFLLDEEYVLASVQNLRQKARSNGSLDDLDRVEVSDDNGDIIIETVEREVVYVPRYDVRVVYGPWWWASYPPVHWAVRHRGLSFIWGPRIYVGPRIHFSAFSWGHRHVVRIDHRTSYRNRYVSRNQILSHRGVKRWAHNPVHRRSAQYRHASVNKRYTPNRSYRASNYKQFRGNKITSANRQERRAVNEKRVSGINSRLNHKRNSTNHKNNTYRDRDNRQNTNAQHASNRNSDNRITRQQRNSNDSRANSRANNNNRATNNNRSSNNTRTSSNSRNNSRDNNRNNNSERSSNRRTQENSSNRNANNRRSTDGAHTRNNESSQNRTLAKNTSKANFQRNSNSNTNSNNRQSITRNTKRSSVTGNSGRDKVSNRSSLRNYATQRNNTSRQTSSQQRRQSNSRNERER